jgi:hypothetical protein
MTDFDWLEPDLRDETLHCLAQPMPRGRDPLSYRDRPLHLDRSEVDGKKHLVFVAYYPYPSVIKRAIPLFESSRYHLTFLGMCIREDYEILRWFHQAHEALDYADMHRLLKGCRAHAVHVTIQPNILGVLAADCASQYRLVLDIVDSQLFQEHGPEHPSAKTEKAILVRSDFLVHKLPPSGVDILQRTSGTDVPHELLHSLPWPPNFRDNMPDPGPPWRIVYAGGVMPYRIAQARGFGHHDFKPVVEAVSRSGIGLTFFVNQNARRMFWDEHDRYFELEQTYPSFKFVRGLPFHRIVDQLKEHHFGLMFDNLTETKFNTDHFRFNMSSKLFSYLEAGLPLIVHDRFDYIVELVREYGLGIVYSLDALHELPELMAKADYKELRKNVDAFRRAHCLETTLPGLERAFGVSHA